MLSAIVWNDNRLDTGEDFLAEQTLSLQTQLEMIEQAENQVQIIWKCLMFNLAWQIKVSGGMWRDEGQGDQITGGDVRGADEFDGSHS